MPTSTPPRPRRYHARAVIMRESSRTNGPSFAAHRAYCWPCCCSCSTPTSAADFLQWNTCATWVPSKPRISALAALCWLIGGIFPGFQLGMRGFPRKILTLHCCTGLWRSSRCCVEFRRRTLIIGSRRSFIALDRLRSSRLHFGSAGRRGRLSSQASFIPRCRHQNG